MAIISLRNVTKDYTVDEETIVTPLHGLNLEVTHGEFIIIIGRSGIGKSTLLNLAGGLIRPSSGEVYIDDVNLWSLNDKKLSLLRNKKIGFIFQFPSLLPSLTALENVAFPAFLGPAKKDAYDRATRLLKMMGLGDRMGAYPRQLSAGEQKRVVVARALINKPEILLADEPTSDLDERTEQEVMAMLRDINQSGVTILMVTHSSELIGNATRVLTVDNGALVSARADKPADILSDNSRLNSEVKANRQL
jgi:ABC-type lipoprotein export system ATPase subunit